MVAHLYEKWPKSEHNFSGLQIPSMIPKILVNPLDILMKLKSHLLLIIICLCVKNGKNRFNTSPVPQIPNIRYLKFLLTLYCINREILYVRYVREIKRTYDLGVG